LGEDYNEERSYDGRAATNMTTIMSAGASLSALTTIIHTMILEPEFPVILLPQTRNQKPIEEGSCGG